MAKNIRGIFATHTVLSLYILLNTAGKIRPVVSVRNLPVIYHRLSYRWVTLHVSCVRAFMRIEFLPFFVSFCAFSFAWPLHINTVIDLLRNSETETYASFAKITKYLLSK